MVNEPLLPSALRSRLDGYDLCRITLGESGSDVFKLAHPTDKDLFSELTRLVPRDEGRRLTHGDASLPNVILSGPHLSGFVDWGRFGVADPYQDLALMARDIASDYGDEWVRPFFQRFGLADPDPAKLRFYRLLDEFF